MRTLKEIFHAFLYHLARIFGLHRRKSSSSSHSNKNNNNNNHGNNNNKPDDLEHQLPPTQLSLSDNSQRSEVIQRPTDDRINGDDDGLTMDDEDDEYDDSTDDNSPPTCGCGRVLKQGWMCSDCRINCSQCGRALGINESCDRCASRQNKQDHHQQQQQSEQHELQSIQPSQQEPHR